VNYRIKLTPTAKKEIRDLPGYVRAQANQLIQGLAQDPLLARAKQLRDKPNFYRVWLAKHWRIVYEVDSEAIVVIVVRVRRKEHIDYDSL